MRRRCFRLSWVVLGFVSLGMWAPAAEAKWKYFRTGNAGDSTAKPRAGFALMGGGAHQEEAFKFLCERANGGDFLILRADTEDDEAKQENKEVSEVCPLNSVGTIVFDSRENADDSEVLKIIEHAEAIFLAGGDQSNYVRFWQETPVQRALDQHVAMGKPIGGSSAGLAVLGEFSFSAMIDTIHSPEALADPYGNKVTLTRDFLHIPIFAGIITDTHFAKRDRLGRLLVFMARILQDGWAPRVRAIAVEEDAAVLVEPDGTAKVVGVGPVYFIEATHKPEICRYRMPLSMERFSVHRAPTGTQFDVKKWSGDKGDDYQLAVNKGIVAAFHSNHAVY